MSNAPTYRDRPAVPARPLPPLPARPPSRPLWFDFILILTGCAVSLVLTSLSGFRAHETTETPSLVTGRPFLDAIPSILFLPLGLLLLWPFFYLTQRLGGRKQHLTAGEWLWGVAWLGAVALTVVWIVWLVSDRPTAFLGLEDFKKQLFVGYAIASLALASFALLIGLVDLIGRWGQPWTHHFVLALLMWPALPLLFLLLWNIEMK
jgi:hypothetical protein